VECEVLRFAEGSEEAVPPGDVAIVEFVNVELVVNGVVLGTLQKIADPVRRANVAVIEVLAKRGKDIEPKSAFD